MCHELQLTLPNLSVCPFCEEIGRIEIRKFSYIEDKHTFGSWQMIEDYYHCRWCEADWQPESLINGRFASARDLNLLAA